jgi:hypothetical protein
MALEILVLLRFMTLFDGYQPFGKTDYLHILHFCTEHEVRRSLQPPHNRMQDVMAQKILHNIISRLIYVCIVVCKAADMK